MKWYDYVDMLLIAIMALLLFLPMCFIMLFVFPAPYVRCIKDVYKSLKKELVK